jgi:uncharacterized membrane protein YGL010W
MKTLEDNLISYAQYHRDTRNILTHAFGVPLIVFAVTVMLSRPQIMGISPAVVTAALSSLFYLRLNATLGSLLSLFLIACTLAGKWIAAQSTAVWLVSGLGVFTFGWVLQFIGHYYEGRKPAFADDLMGLMQGPLFVLSEALFALGWNPELKAKIEAVAGPLRTGKVSAAV